MTLAECSFDTGLGSEVDVAAVAAEGSFSDIATVFGESASRVVVSVAAGRTAELLELATAAKIPATAIGRVGGDRMRLAVSGRAVIDAPLREVERIWATAIDRFFEPRRAIA